MTSSAKVVGHVFVAIIASASVAQTKSQIGGLEDVLHHYEVISLSDIRHHRVTRSASSETRHMEFDAFNRHFQLKLQTHKDILASDVRIVSLDAESHERDVPLDNRKFYHGRLEDDETSRVTAYEDDDGTLTATIRTKDDVYSIESSRGHFPSEDQSTMIAYRYSDLKSDVMRHIHPVSSYSVEEDEVTEWDDTVKADERQAKRVKREGEDTAEDRKTCPLLLVADYRFFQQIGGSDYHRTASYMIGLADRVDTIYRSTSFGGAYHGMGFEIKEIRIHTAATASLEKYHYNQERNTPWDTKELLEAFSADTLNMNRCQCHLFTAATFDTGTLGLSYVASPYSYNPGGICSPVYYKEGRRLYMNTGWSSGLGQHGRRLLTQEVDLLTAHGFGHNWGSKEDPNNTECSPEGASGGKYLMHPYPLTGFQPNNWMFSPCSKRSINRVLASKSQYCFLGPAWTGGLCGNSIVDREQCEGDDCDHTGDEECDAGPHTPRGTDPCCDQHCQLRPEAQCSDAEGQCCSQCRFTPGLKCQESSPEACDLDAYCTGSSDICPSNWRPDGENCTQAVWGKCLRGSCEAFCETVGLQSCVCDHPSDSCLFCCRLGDDDPCQVYRESDPHPLPDGWPCLTGNCLQGVCKHTRPAQDAEFRWYPEVTTKEVTGETTEVLTTVSTSLATTPGKNWWQPVILLLILFLGRGW